MLPLAGALEAWLLLLHEALNRRPLSQDRRRLRAGRVLFGVAIFEIARVLLKIVEEFAHVDFAGRPAND